LSVAVERSARQHSRRRYARTIGENLALLARKQCAKVVTVTYFKFDAVQGSPEKQRLYVEENLAKEAGMEM
jgi:hypothetical protein